MTPSLVIVYFDTFENPTACCRAKNPTSQAMCDTVGHVQPTNLRGDGVQPEDITTQSKSADFGDDDLGRLQGILFGDHARRTNERMETLEEALLGAIEDLRQAIQSQFVDLERRLDGESETRSKAIANVTEQVKGESRNRETATKAIRGDFDKGYEQTSRAIDDLERRAKESLEETRTELSAEIEAGLGALDDKVVPRDGLAKALVRAAEELAEASDT